MARQYEQSKPRKTNKIDVLTTNAMLLHDCNSFSCLICLPLISACFDFKFKYCGHWNLKCSNNEYWNWKCSNIRINEIYIKFAFKKQVDKSVHLILKCKTIIIIKMDENIKFDWNPMFIEYCLSLWKNASKSQQAEWMRTKDSLQNNQNVDGFSYWNYSIIDCAITQTNQPASTDHHEQQKYQSEYIVCTVCSLWSTSSNCKQTIAPMIAMQPSFRASLNVPCCIIDRSLSNWPMPQCRSYLHFHKKTLFGDCNGDFYSIEIRTVAFELPFERKQQSKLGNIESGFVEIRLWVLLFWANTMWAPFAFQTKIILFLLWNAFKCIKLFVHLVVQIPSIVAFRFYCVF